MPIPQVEQFVVLITDINTNPGEAAVLQQWHFLLVSEVKFSLPLICGLFSSEVCLASWLHHVRLFAAQNAYFVNVFVDCLGHYCITSPWVIIDASAILQELTSVAHVSRRSQGNLQQFGFNCFKYFYAIYWSWLSLTLLLCFAYFLPRVLCQEAYLVLHLLFVVVFPS